MAARGRGGKTSSLTREQLQAMGCVGKDAIQQVQTVPPPTYPTLLNRPVAPKANTKEQEKEMIWKEEFLKYLHESPYYKASDEEQKAVVSLGAWEKWAEMILGPKKIIPEEYNWKFMPKELQSKKKRKQKLAHTVKAKKIKILNPDEKLKALEEKEKSDDQTEKPTKTEDSDEDENAEEEMVVDEEMDDENDYGVSYFDNGEAYNEDDDNLDDGPVY